eukprot:scaffold106372_cov19-Tisochrysis_lutea.AAC.1
MFDRPTRRTPGEDVGSGPRKRRKSNLFSPTEAARQDRQKAKERRDLQARIDAATTLEAFNIFASMDVRVLASSIAMNMNSKE